MSKQRKSEKDKQSGFSQYHYKLGTKYLSDFDSVSSTNGVIHDTENEIYSQYKYSDNTPTVTNFIETSCAGIKQAGVAHCLPWNSGI